MSALLADEQHVATFFVLTKPSLDFIKYVRHLASEEIVLGDGCSVFEVLSSMPCRNTALAFEAKAPDNERYVSHGVPGQYLGV